MDAVTGTIQGEMIMNDLIDRQMAIDEAYEINIDGQKFEVVQVETLMGLPSAQPERKRGKWITSHVPESILWECNQCGFPCGAHSFNFCPNCGADMWKKR